MKEEKSLRYSLHWLSKGQYGEERVKRMIIRKQKRWRKRQDSMERNHKKYQVCEMGGMCEYPCNGDC